MGERKHLCFFKLTLVRSEVILILPRKAQTWPIGQGDVWQDSKVWLGSCVSGGGVGAGEPILCMYTV